MKKAFSIFFGLILLNCPVIFAQNKINTSTNNFKIYNIGNYQIKYAKGAKLDWGQAYDLIEKSDESNVNEWRLPTVEELREIYFFRESIGIKGGTFWSSSLKAPLRMGFIYCIDFSNGVEVIDNKDKYLFLLVKHAKY